MTPRGPGPQPTGTPARAPADVPAPAPADVPVPVQVLVLAKQPRPGHAKTRLTPPLAPGQAAEVARAALLDTLAAVTAAPVSRRVLVLDGSPAALPVAGFDVLPQVAGDLGARLAAAYDAAWAGCALPLLLVGMDTPQLTADLLLDCARALLRPGTDAVLGRAADGGWWTLGLRRPLAGAFHGVPMSTGRTGDAQAERLVALGMRVTEAPVLRDVDHADDVAAVAAAMPPASAFARAAAALGLAPVPG